MCCLQNERCKPRAFCQLSRKGEHFPASPQWFPRKPIHHQHNGPQHKCLPDASLLTVQTCYSGSNCLERSGSSASCKVWNCIYKNPSIPSQGPLLTTYTTSVVFATQCNGRLPRTVSIILSIFMPCICKLLYRICYLRARSYCSIFEHLYEIKSFRGGSATNR